MKKFILPATFAIALLCAQPSFADDVKVVGATSGTAVTLSASSQKKVVQDLLVASLRVEIEDKDAAKVQNDINKAMKAAVDLAKADASIKVNTGSYYVYSYDPNPSPKQLSSAELKKRSVWKGSQTIELQSKDAQKILELVAKVQDMGFAMNNLSYTLSPELAEAQKDQLLVEAIKKIQDKAQLVAKTLGKAGYDLSELNIDGSYMPQPTPMMAMARDGGMEKATMAAPVAEPSEADVTLSVTAKVVLK